MGETKPNKRSILGNPLRTPGVYKVLNFVFALLILAALILILTNNQKTFYPYTWLQLVLGAGAGVLVIFQVQQIFEAIPTPKGATEAIILVLFFILFSWLQYAVGGAVMASQEAGSNYWDVYERASVYVLNRKQLPDAYFLSSPQDTGLYVLLCGYFRLVFMFGAREFLIPMMLLNIIAMDISVLLIYRTARRALGFQRAVFALLLCILLPGMWMQAGLVSAQILAMPFAAGIVYLWTSARQNWRNGESGKAAGQYCLLSALAAIGAVLNVAVLLIWLAVTLDLLILLSGMRGLLLLLGTVVLSATFLAETAALSKSKMLPEYDYENYGRPLNHWVAAGLDDNPSGHSTLEAQEGTRQQQKQRNEEYIDVTRAELGVGGMVKHLSNKLSYLLGDGTYFAADAMQGVSTEKGNMYKLIVPKQRGFTAIAILALLMQVTILCWSMVSAMATWLRKNEYFTFVRIAIMLNAIYCLVWETTPSSMLVCLPCLLLCVLEAYPVRVSEKDKQSARAHLMERTDRLHEKEKADPQADKMQELVAAREERRNNPHQAMMQALEEVVEQPVIQPRVRVGDELDEDELFFPAIEELERHRQEQQTEEDWMKIEWAEDDGADGIGFLTPEVKAEDEDLFSAIQELDEMDITEYEPLFRSHVDLLEETESGWRS